MWDCGEVAEFVQAPHKFRAAMQCVEKIDSRHWSRVLRYMQYFLTHSQQ